MHVASLWVAPGILVDASRLEITSLLIALESNSCSACWVEQHCDKFQLTIRRIAQLKADPLLLEKDSFFFPKQSNCETGNYFFHLSHPLQFLWHLILLPSAVTVWVHWFSIDWSCNFVLAKCNSITFDFCGEIIDLQGNTCLVSFHNCIWLLISTKISSLYSFLVIKKCGEYYLFFCNITVTNKFVLFLFHILTFLLGLKYRGNMQNASRNVPRVYPVIINVWINQSQSKLRISHKSSRSSFTFG